jgi:heat shock protein HslJ
MKRPFTLFAAFALAAAALTASAQQFHTLTHDDLTLTYDTALGSAVQIATLPGDPVDLQSPNGPIPPHTRIIISATPDEMPDPFSQPTIYAFDTADFAAYPPFAAQADALIAILATRPDLAQYLSISGDASQNPELPFLPPQPASQVIRAQPVYVGNQQFSGIRYLAIYSFDVSPFTAERVVYTFQAVSADGSRYIAVRVPLTTTLLPTDIPADFDDAAFNATFTQYLAETTTALGEAAPSDFSPSLDTLDALISTIQLGSTGGGVGAPTLMETPMPSPTEVTGSAGLLSGEWTLASAGDPAAPRAPLTDAVPTILFEANGMSGFAGCNRYFGGFSFGGDSISFTDIGATRMACDQPRMEQESFFFAALMGATTFSLDGDTLTINYTMSPTEGTTESGALVFTRTS